MKVKAFMIVLAVVLLPAAVLADVPGLMSYQGTLTDDAGVAMDTTVSMTFTIYDDSTGGTPAWTETQPAVEVNDGLFNVVLGRMVSIPDTVFLDVERWLGIQVGGDPELGPRQRITAVGYAFQSGGDGDWTVSGDDVYSTVSGNVGIGISSPAYKLHVNGDIQADSLYRIRGQEVLSTKGTGNILVGGEAGLNNTGQYNTFLGEIAGYNSTGNYNVFIGYEAGGSTGGGQNTCVGHLAGRFNQSGDVNTFVGNSAGLNVESGDANTYIGASAGEQNSTGWSNVMVGDQAGKNKTAGSNNTFLGNYSGQFSTTGHNNVFIGNSAGYRNTGSQNTIVGGWAGYDTSSGSNNVFVGYQAGYYEEGSNRLHIANTAARTLIYGEFDNKVVGIDGDLGVGTITPAARLHVNGAIRLETGTRDFQIQEVDTSDPEGWSSYINYGGIGIGSNTGGNRQMVMFTDGSNQQHIFTVATSENDGVTWQADFNIMQNGRVGIGETNPGYLLDVAGDIECTTLHETSDGRLKTNIGQLSGALDRVRQLRGVTFQWSREAESEGASAARHIGVVAQEVEAVFPELVSGPEDGYKSVEYGKLTAVLIEAMKEQQAQIERQQAEIEALKDQMEALR